MKKTMVVRLTTFLVVAVFAIGVTAQMDPPFEQDPGGSGGGNGGSCQACQATWDGNTGVMFMSCIQAPSGGWGRQNCRIESYPEATYCFVDGNSCCVD